MSNRVMSVLYLVPILMLLLIAVGGAFMLFTSVRPADVPLRSDQPGYTWGR
jgi:hypothetical protein